MIIVHDSADKIKSGVEERDIALKTGAIGALVITFRNGNLGFPVRGIRLSDLKDLYGKLRRLDLRENDTIVISFADTYARAEDGAIAIALSLSEIR